MSVTNTEADVHGDHPAVLPPAAGGFRVPDRRPVPPRLLPAAGLTGAVLNLRTGYAADREVLGRSTEDPGATNLADISDTRSRVDELAAFLAERWPASDPTALRVAELVETIADDRRSPVALGRELVEFGPCADLQRIFADYVGRRPNRVVQRYRLQDAAAAGVPSSRPTGPPGRGAGFRR